MIIIEYSFKCDKCGVIHKEESPHNYFAKTAISLWLPEGWIAVSSDDHNTYPKIYCPKHKVEIALNANA